MNQQLPASNMLQNESSPYLVQHADNPVHWRPWSKAALDEARQTNKPVLVSIGYAACHWCHVMAHESFENPDIAKLMNQLFVNIKVDREERPDIDQIYMAALHAMGEQGGWPLTIFVDPDGRPFWGGTYFPPEQKHGRPGFPDILRAISKAWRTERNRIDANGVALGRFLDAQAAPPENPSQPDISQFTAFANAVLSIQDPVHGGTKGSPKFPNAAMNETLLRAAAGDIDSAPAKAFLKLMTQMSLGGIYDHVGGGLSRYSVDEYWLVPHFEKMLYDNAHYLRQLGWAYKLRPNNLFRARIEQTLDWLNREMLLPGGAYASSLDADTEGEEGKYYVWSSNEISQILRSKRSNFLSAYDITTTGNFEGNNIPNLLRFTDLNEAESIRKIFTSEIQKLLNTRLNREPPGRDDKILTDWNGYLVRTLAELSFQFGKRNWLNSALKTFHYISESISDGTALPHSFRNDTAVRPAMATDYASMINAAISLAEITGDSIYLEHARNWFDILEKDYSDDADGFFLTSVKSESLILRPRCDLDEANPSAASQILEAYVRFSAITAEEEYKSKAWNLAANINSAIGKSGHGSAGFFNALHTLFNHRHVKIYAKDDLTAQPFLNGIRNNPKFSLSFEIVRDNKPAKYLGYDITAPNQIPSAIICANQACSQPITSIDEFRLRLIQ